MAKKLTLDTKYLDGFISSEDLGKTSSDLERAHAYLTERKGPGNEFLGWMDLPEEIDENTVLRIEKAAADLNKISDAIVVIGIGGSYLGARATIDTLVPEAINEKIFFAGYNLSGDYMHRLLDKLKDRDVSIIVISKSGTTTEPAIAFRVVKNFLEEKYGSDGLRNRIVCVTDREKGALRNIADKEGYTSFDISDDIGGRYSVLTPVGLLPMACAGIDIRDLISGAKEQRKDSLDCDLDTNISYKYAAVRNILYHKGKRIEILSSFDNNLHYIDEWWKQLFGESEGKGGRSIFPASCDFSTDLHSMGQLIQQGERDLFETFLIIETAGNRCEIPHDEDNLDNLNYLAGKQIDYVNRKAHEATAEAHFEGGVPNLTVFLPEKSAFSLGCLFYFFEKAAGISGHMFKTNPFDQPGVEAYKQKMFRLLGKPGS
ncbi:MAG: glucose-6-phosphate isomerase [Candidatus Omnitrophica bacterium]|nr:glucose-6-phosphate isomerase [Candidatus Omnitrophota bacterium]